jgi:hypothetical protein
LANRARFLWASAAQAAGARTTRNAQRFATAAERPVAACRKFSDAHPPAMRTIAEPAETEIQRRARGLYLESGCGHGRGLERRFVAKELRPGPAAGAPFLTFNR